MTVVELKMVDARSSMKPQPKLLRTDHGCEWTLRGRQISQLASRNPLSQSDSNASNDELAEHTLRSAHSSCRRDSVEYRFGHRNYRWHQGLNSVRKRYE